ncbi:hypothetical protein P20652_3999 [Pseudoalteromonas sp. BSi20652]|nr:hypothetical protein P20652_3999 [Pseudoalteromonas sp. BSi20652]
MAEGYDLSGLKPLNLGRFNPTLILLSKSVKPNRGVAN